MTKLYLAICKNRFYLYDETCKPFHVDGEAFFEYETNKIREAAIRLTEKIIDENNLANKNELNFFIIENSDKTLNESFAKAQGKLIVKKFSLNELLQKTISELAKSPGLYISELGINYDGECYRTNNGLLIKQDYSLLALSIEPAALLKFIY